MKDIESMKDMKGIFLKDNVLTLGYMKIIFVNQKPVAYTRYHGTVHYIKDKIAVSDLAKAFGEIKVLKEVSEEQMVSGFPVIIMSELGLWELHSLEDNMWSAL